MDGLTPFKGLMCPGIYFDSGYCIWLVKWDVDPTEYDNLSEIWIFNPQGERNSFVNPGNAKDFIKIYHDFNNVFVADINWDFQDDNQLHIDLDGEDKKELNLEIKLGTIIIQDFPCTDGKTETGKRYRHCPDKIAMIATAKGSFNKKNLGKIVSPSRPINVGDGQVPERPIFSFCTHYLEYGN